MFNRLCSGFPAERSQSARSSVLSVNRHARDRAADIWGQSSRSIPISFQERGQATTSRISEGQIKSWVKSWERPSDSSGNAASLPRKGAMMSYSKATATSAPIQPHLNTVADKGGAGSKSLSPMVSSGEPPDRWLRAR